MTKINDQNTKTKIQMFKTMTLKNESWDQDSSLENHKCNNNLT